MKPEKTLKVGLVAAFALLAFVSPVFAGGGYEPPGDATITGPEIWGVVVIDCTNDRATVRVKQVVNCVTQTEAKAGQWTGCPANLAEVEGESLPLNTTFFGITGTAFINKAKNFKIDGDIRSFDAQFKFWY